MLDNIKMEVLSSINRTVEELQKKLDEVERKQQELKNHEELQARQIRCQIAVAMINNEGFSPMSKFDVVIERVLGERETKNA